jgi:small subunit ribosomal protein S17e
MDRIKRLSYEVLDEHKSKFGVDFADNKQVLNQISIIRSKGLKNEIAGYITKFIKKEIREEKTKQDRIEASRSITETEQDIEIVNDSSELSTPEDDDSVIVMDNSTSEVSETVEEKTE